MTFVTKLRFSSGDREALDDAVGHIKRLLERKGVECKGPHADPPERIRVPLYATLAPGGEFDEWSYRVYTRRIEIHGSEETARDIAERTFPDSIRVEIEIDRKRPLGSRDD